MTNLASGDGEGDGRSSSMPRLQLDGGPVHVDIVLGIHGIRCGKRVLDLALGSGVQLLGLLTECLSQILDPFVQSLSTSTFLVEVNPASEALILQ